MLYNESILLIMSYSISKISKYLLRFTCFINFFFGIIALIQSWDEEIKSIRISAIFVILVSFLFLINEFICTKLSTYSLTIIVLIAISIIWETSNIHLNLSQKNMLEIIILIVIYEVPFFIILLVIVLCSFVPSNNHNMTESLLNNEYDIKSRIISSETIDNSKITEKKCSICTENFENDEILLVFTCSENIYHAYHEVCILGWIKSYKTCPNCRDNINEMYRITYKTINDIV